MDFYDSFHANPMYPHVEVYPKLMNININEYNNSVIKQLKNIFVAVFVTSKHELTAESKSP